MHDTTPTGYEEGAATTNSPANKRRHMNQKSPLTEDAQETHLIYSMLHCTRTQLESAFTASAETPFCPHCGQRLITATINHLTERTGPSETTIAAYEKLFTQPLPSGDNPLHG